jgi:hypothetical protein
MMTKTDFIPRLSRVYPALSCCGYLCSAIPRPIYASTHKYLNTVQGITVVFSRIRNSAGQRDTSNDNNLVRDRRGIHAGYARALSIHHSSFKGEERCW